MREALHVVITGDHERGGSAHKSFGELNRWRKARIPRRRRLFSSSTYESSVLMAMAPQRSSESLEA